MKIKIKISRDFFGKILVLLCGIFTTLSVSAKLVFVTEENSVNNNNFIINADDSSSDFVDLDFGSALGVKIRYDILNNNFILNRDLNIDGNAKLIGSTPTLFFNKDEKEFLRWNNSTKLQFGMNGNLVAEITRISTDSASFQPKQFSTGTTADNNPAFSFQQDPDTGVFRENINKVGFATGGVGRLIVDENGKVGIGTSSPETTLHIKDTSSYFNLQLESDAPTILLKDSSSDKGIVQSWGGNLNMGIVDSSNNWKNGHSDLMIINNGNVGIGDDTPDAKLDVAGSFRLDGTFADKDGDVGTSGQVLTSTLNGTDWVDANTVIGAGMTAGSIVFSDGNNLSEDNQNLYWDNTNKRLGIGVSASPSAMLHVGSTPPVTTNFSDSFEDGTITPFTTYGDANWSIDSNNANDGTKSAVAPASLNDNQQSSLEYTTTIANSGGQVSFDRKVSSESNYDFLRFYIDGTQKAQWSGEVAWSNVSYSVSSGTHTFKWTYSKDGSVSNGSDVAWVDKVQITNVLVSSGGSALFNGKIGIGTTNPESMLSVVGLPSGTTDSATSGSLSGAVCITDSGNMYIDTDGTCAN